jgi:hypothetical protein
VGIFVSASLTIPQIPRLASLARDDSGEGRTVQDDSKEGAASLRMTAKKGSLAANDITARPPGSRDGCPTIAPRFNGIDLWGTRLACRMHGWSTAH